MSKQDEIKFLIFIIMFYSLIGMFSETVVGEWGSRLFPSLKASVLMFCLSFVLYSSYKAGHRLSLSILVGLIILIFKTVSGILFYENIRWNSVLGAGIYVTVFIMIFSIEKKEKNQNIRKTMFMLFLIGLISSILFYYIGMKMYPCSYLKSFTGLKGFSRWILQESFIGAFVSSLIVPVLARQFYLLKTIYNNLKRNEKLRINIALSFLILINLYLEKVFS